MHPATHHHTVTVRLDLAHCALPWISVGRMSFRNTKEIVDIQEVVNVA